MSAEITNQYVPADVLNKLNNGSNERMIVNVPRPLSKREKENPGKKRKRIILLAIIATSIVIVSATLAVVIYITVGEQDDHGGTKQLFLGENSTVNDSGGTTQLRNNSNYGDASGMAGNSTVSKESETQISNISGVHMKTGTIYIGEGYSFISCQVTNVRDWRSITIEKMEEDTWIEKATLHMNQNKISFIKDTGLPFTLESDIGNDNITFTMKFEDVSCKDAGEYICSVNITDNQTIFSAKSVLKIRARPQTPRLIFPAEIVEDKTTALKCEAITDYPDARLVWRIKSPTDSDFIELPQELTQEYRTSNSDCKHELESFLSHTPKLSKNGTTFQCEVLNKDKSRVYAVEDQLAVIESDFCADKTPGSMHQYPYNTCDSIIYCDSLKQLLVLSLCEHDPGKCYDFTANQCVDPST